MQAPANPPARAIAAAAATATIIFAIHPLLYSSKPSGLALLLGAMGAVGMLCAIKWMARLIDYSRQAQRPTILPLFRCAPRFPNRPCTETLRCCALQHGSPVPPWPPHTSAVPTRA